MEYIDAKKIVHTAKSSNGYWFDATYNMNIYKGCNHACIYCDSRSDCYHIDRFNTVRAKKDALILIEKELKSKRKKGIIATGAMSDPYNYHEKELCLTRNALKLINNNSFGVITYTKSDLIIRDIDILEEINSKTVAYPMITITTSNDKLSKVLEPNVSNTSERFNAVKELTKANITTGVLMMPILPLINDTTTNVVELVEMSKKNGAAFIYPSFGFTMRDGSREYLYDKLDSYFPTLKDEYINMYGNSYICNSPNYKELKKAFVNACEHHNILYKISDINKKIKFDYEKNITANVLEQSSLF